MEKTNTTKEKAIYTEIKERVEETRREDKRFSELWDKMEKSLTTKEKKEFENINFNKEHHLRASLFDFGYVTGYEVLKEDILKLIDEDIKYQKKKLTGNFERDKQINWRITGFEYLKKELNSEVRNSSQP